jgi:hypothetical protein
MTASLPVVIASDQSVVPVNNPMGNLLSQLDLYAQQASLAQLKQSSNGFIPCEIPTFLGGF